MGDYRDKYEILTEYKARDWDVNTW
jgi:hypothetical protein